MTVSSPEHGTPPIPTYPHLKSPITVYRDGRFVTEEAPDWWWAEFERIYPESTERAPNVQRVVYGNIERISVNCWSFTRGLERGRLLEIEDGRSVDDGPVEVWVPTDADWLDFVTARLPALLDVSRRVDQAAAV